MEKKTITSKKKNKEVTETAQPEVMFLGANSNKSTSLITLGVIAVVLGFLSATPIMAQTIFSESADFIVGMGLVGIVVGIILNNRQRISDLFNPNKKNQ